MLPTGFEPTIPAVEWLRTNALDRWDRSIFLIRPTLHMFCEGYKQVLTQLSTQIPYSVFRTLFCVNRTAHHLSAYDVFMD